jgi:uncharacterized protein (TIRG00374 family)
MMIVASSLMASCTSLLNALRWNGITRSLGFDVDLKSHVRYTFVSLFVGSFVPVSVGADLVRVFLLAHGPSEIPVAIVSVVGDRAVAVAFTVFAFVFVQLVLNAHWILAAVFLLLACIAVAAFVFLPLKSLLRGARTLKLFDIIFSGRRDSFVVKSVSALFRSLEKAAIFFNEQPRALVEVAVLTIIMHALGALAVYVCVWLISGNLISPLNASLIISTFLLSALFPISIGGWGVREMATAHTLWAGNLDVSASVFVALSISVGTTLASIPGIVWVERSLFSGVKNFKIDRLKAVPQGINNG